MVRARPTAAALPLPAPLLQLTPPGGLLSTAPVPRQCRSEALDRFAVINVQYQHLVDALRPLLRQFAAYPRSVNQVRRVAGFQLCWPRGWHHSCGSMACSTRKAE